MAKKIGIFLGSNIPSYWAHSFNVMKMAQGFYNIGCHVEVITADSRTTETFKKDITDIYSHYGIAPGIKVRYMSPSRKAYLSGKTKHDLTFCLHAAKYAKEQGFDFVYCRNSLIPTLTAGMGIPTFIETHSVSKPDNYRWKLIQEEIARLPSFKGLVTIHHDLKAEYVKRGIPENKILVLEDGVDLSGFEIEENKVFWRNELGLDPHRYYAVYCGHLYPEKGIEVILEAAKQLRHWAKLTFLLVGGLAEDKEYWEYICNRENITNVKFTGFVPNVMVPKYLKSADCLLLPYKTKNITYKRMDLNTTSPLKLFEYLASKRPIVATSLPTLRKVLRHHVNSLLVEPDNIEDFCSTIKTLLTDRELGAILAKRAYQDAIAYTWENRCKAILQLLD